MRRSLLVLSAAGLLAACSAGPGPSNSSTDAAGATLTPAAAAPSAAATPDASRRTDWPFVRTSCPTAPGTPLVVTALGTSESAGWAIRADEPYSPQDAPPARYADILCGELNRPVELRSYFPPQLGNEMAPLEWWVDNVRHDGSIRQDLAEADVVFLWALSSHDALTAYFLSGGCSGAWPNPLRACLEKATSSIPSRTDELFRLVSGLTSHNAIVLAGDAYAPPLVISSLMDDAHRDEIRRMLDPYYSVKPMAATHGFVFVDTELEFNGPSRWEMPAAGLFQADGVHPTEAGAKLIAEVYARADGLGG